MIAFAFLATVINYLDRQTLSVAAPVLRDQFHMSNVDYSRVVFAFMLAYTIMNGASGPLIDRLGTRLGYALTMAWWSLAAICHAFAQGAVSLGAFRFLLGMGEAGNWPAGVKVVAEWFPERERALASGLFNTGSAVGAVLAPPIVAAILLHYGWRTAFVAVGLAGLVWLLFWCPVYRTPSQGEVLNRGAAPLVRGRRPRRPSCSGPDADAIAEGGTRADQGVRPTMDPADASPVPVLGLIRTRFVWSFTLAKIFMDPVWYFYTFWFPEYLKHARDFNLAAIGKFAWIPFAVAGAGNLLGGWLSAFLLSRGCSLTVARKSAITVFAVLMLSAIPAVLVRDAALSIGLVSIAMLGYTGSLANMLAMPADVFGKNAVASVYGLASMGSGFGGMLFTLITGWVVDHYSYTPVFIGFGILPLICATLLWTLMGRLERHAT
jgi:ACS family hexuronate transporter-like MFS transporter